MASFRLNKVAKDFNVGIQTLVDYLAKKGHQVEASPNTKISEEQYELLATAFQGERKVKEEADKIELVVNNSNRVVEVSTAKEEPESENEEVIKKVLPRFDAEIVPIDLNNRFNLPILPTKIGVSAPHIIDGIERTITLACNFL